MDALNDDCGQAPEKKKRSLPKLQRRWATLIIVGIVLVTIVCFWFAALNFIDYSLSYMSKTLDKNFSYHFDGSIDYNIPLSENDDSQLIKITTLQTDYFKEYEINDTNAEHEHKIITATYWEFKSVKAAEKYYKDIKSTLERLPDMRSFTVSRYIFCFPTVPDDVDSSDSMSEGSVAGRMMPFTFPCVMYRVLTFDFRFDDILGK